ncbi:MAG: hypothetical protein J0L95_15995 [Candidatus Accumulibacter sp.]|jgi:hypothetical protein|uniref:hypothetical protein n=1 Tax=Accumulibacter sp. TaxID=2053492 RepID=UPI001ACE885E|nr:hypothetical protein [Accumulibacter sp.]MBN8439526.1 hypothetical protein [Accumulibacter sp.]
MRRNVYLHFMNRDARDILGIFQRLKRPVHCTMLSRALNAAVILCEQHTVMPPGFFLECDLAYEVVSGRKALIDAGLIILPQRELSLERMIEKKRSEYASVRASFEGLFDDRRIQIFSDARPIFIHRDTKIGSTATEKWEDGPDVANNWIGLKQLLSSDAIENARSSPRTLLDRGEALTWPALKPHLSSEVLHHESLVRLYLQRNYFRLYVEEFELVVVRQIPHLVDEFDLPSPSNEYSYHHLERALSLLRIEWLLDVSAETLVRLKSSAGFIRFVDCYVQMAAIARSVPNLILILADAMRRIDFPVILTLPTSGDATLFPEVAIAESDERALIEALGQMAASLEETYDLYARAPSLHVSHAISEGGFVPWQNPLADRKSKRRGDHRMNSLKNVVLATANARETRAVLQTIRRHCPPDHPDLEFLGRQTAVPRWSTKMATKHGEVSIAVTQADETGGDEAVDLLRRVVEELHPDAVFFVGCAALLDEKAKHKKNAVYLARRGIDSDKVELRAADCFYDMDTHHGDQWVRRTIVNLAGAGVFEPIELIANRDFISGSAFVGDRQAQRRKDLVSKFPQDAVVLEMEAFMVYKELFRMRSAGLDVSASVVKGISDVGDETAQVDKDETQRVAAANAATVVVKFLIEVAG